MYLVSATIGKHIRMTLLILAIPVSNNNSILAVFHTKIRGVVDMYSLENIDNGK